MSKLNLFLWLIVSVVLSVVLNIVAAGLVEKYQLVSDERRWILVIIASIVFFALLVWFESRREQADGNSRASINKIITGFGTRTGKINMQIKGAPSDVNANVAELGPKTITEDIKMKYKDDKTD